VSDKNPISVSLILCSRNRSRELQTCLQRIPVKEIDEVNGEIVLVDSCSEDSTRSVMQAFADRCPCPVTIVHAQRPGLGLARNLGIAASRGPVLAFTDDDCYLAKDYMHKAATVFEGSGFQFCGGKILLYDPTDAMYSVNYQDHFEIVPAFSFIRGGRFQGANMVISRQVFEKIGGFDTALGAGTRFRCEDIEFIGRASMNGFTGAHVPDLVVYHHHGRKRPSRALKILIRKNEMARGAYYASMISQGFSTYWKDWFMHSVIHSIHKPWKYSYYRSITRETIGALLYWHARRNGKLDT
jgi:glycosyltransferase involved in cell wall biosynthesis